MDKKGHAVYNARHKRSTGVTPEANLGNPFIAAGDEVRQFETHGRWDQKS